MASSLEFKLAISMVEGQIASIFEKGLLEVLKKTDGFNYDVFDPGADVYFASDDMVPVPESASNWEKIVQLCLANAWERLEEFTDTAVYHTRSEVKNIIKVMLRHGWDLSLIEPVKLYINVVDGEFRMRELSVPEDMEEFVSHARRIWKAQDCEELESQLFKAWSEYMPLDPTHILAGMYAGVPLKDRPRKWIPDN